MKKLLFILHLSFLINFHSSAQDSCALRISLLTCAPGAELYSTFGHTAIRVIDKSTGADYIFNYGTFEFSPDFYVKFIKGQLLYYLSVESFSDFMRQYQLESRSVEEQVLQLSCSEKEKLFLALKTNALEQNKYYRYDFLFDNCTTRAKDIISNNTDSPVVFKNILPDQIPTFRNLIHVYLNKNGADWSKLGIDLLLGAKLDRKVTNEQAMFLPDNLLMGLDSANTKAKGLVAEKKVILQMPSPNKNNSLFSPFLIFSILLIGVILLSIITPGAKNIIATFDFVFFLLLGLVGCLLIFMWVGTDHNVTQSNYNLLWALPTHLVMAFFLKSNTAWSRNYFRFIFWLCSALLLLWFFLPQQMNNGFLPVVFIILFRSWSLSKKHHAQKRVSI